ncbi:hypothetical protein MLD38_011278 [Melastoma candidum]|uniref:Uncharacterized protein n=1 Tax=Melastoma candidum TaxID=119954 RepID=A0ACB9R3N8_9MYRT|nr:hypothetical protein MLD38_011278 [Melastoma candidum]
MLDEVQNQLSDLGKPFGSMNLDEILKSILTANTGESTGVGADASEDNAVSGNQSTLPHQPGMSLAGVLSKKTVDDVWKEILHMKRGGEKKPKEQPPTLGEMTLEDFLVKAGVFVGSTSDKRTTDVLNSSIGTQAPPQAQTLPQPLQMGPFPMMDLPFDDNHRLVLPSPLTGVLLDIRPCGRKRGIPDDIVDKSIERKQKRMIKNRESAARSRARKQAYTNELENKVSCLEEENERLRKRKELQKMLLHAPLPGPIYQLRRTSSAPY